MSSFSRLVAVVAVIAAVVVAGAITFVDAVHSRMPAHQTTNLTDRVPVDPLLAIRDQTTVDKR